ncbi:hypothetical protein MMC22_008597 [Lobaria immixta]|nr:hypothetical protein [Lobaria immixta]
MAPSSGHLLVPKALRIAKFAISQTTALIRSKLPQSTTSSTATAGALLQPVHVNANPHPTHPLAILKQFRSQHRWFSAAARNFSSKSGSQIRGRYDRSSFPVSKVSKTIALRGAAPFASTLRPNLTGGALPRSAGGYSLGGGGIAGRGARHFSHTPSAQAQVVQNVSAGIRAFFVGGGKARFDGLDGKNGEKRYKAVSRTEDEVLHKLDRHFKTHAKGTNLEFQLSPTITAFSTKISTTDSTEFDVQTLLCPDMLSNISIDFARALKDLSAVLADLQRLSALGDLPINFSHTPSGPILTCRFSGCDGRTVSRLCDEVNIQRGIVREDEAWERDRDVEMALLFPFAPGSAGRSEVGDEANDCFGPASATSEQLDWRHMMSPQEPFIPFNGLAANNEHEVPAPGGRQASLQQNSKSLSGYESLRESDFTEDDPYVQAEGLQTRESASGSEGYEGLEGIYRFLKECEDARR